MITVKIGFDGSGCFVRKSQPMTLLILLILMLVCGNAQAYSRREIKMSNGLTLVMNSTAVSEEQFLRIAADLGNGYAPDMAPLRFEDPSFIDAEKFSTEYPDYDSLLCWAAACSNVLTLSGWNGDLYADEDRVFDYYSKRLTNEGCDIEIGLGWFFTGEYPAQNEPYAAHLRGGDLPAAEDRHWPEYCPAALITRPDSFDNMITAFEIRDTSVAIGVEYEYDDSRMGDDSFHAVTMAGYVIDKNESDYRKRYKAILIADSDNDSGYVPSRAEIDSTDAEKNAQRAARPNSYTAYALDHDDELERWVFVNYARTPGLVAVLSAVNALADRDASCVPEALEKAGSMDPYTDPDLTLYDVTDERHDPILGSIPYEPGEEITLYLQVGTVGPVDIPDGTEIPVSYELKRNGRSVPGGMLTVTAEDLTGYRLDGSCMVFPNRKPDGTPDEWPEGEYEITVTLNPVSAGGQWVRETYTLDNKPMTEKFVISSRYPPLPPTGDSTPVALLCLMLAGAIGLAVLTVRKYRT